MLHTSNPIIKHKAGLLNLAEELGNVSEACKVMGVSRDTFYRYQELVEDGGVDMPDNTDGITRYPQDGDGGYISPDDMMPSDGVNNKGEKDGGN